MVVRRLRTSRERREVREQIQNLDQLSMTFTPSRNKAGRRKLQLLLTGPFGKGPANVTDSPPKNGFDDPASSLYAEATGNETIPTGDPSQDVSSNEPNHQMESLLSVPSPVSSKESALNSTNSPPLIPANDTARTTSDPVPEMTNSSTTPITNQIGSNGTTPVDKQGSGFTDPAVSPRGNEKNETTPGLNSSSPSEDGSTPLPNASDTGTPRKSPTLTPTQAPTPAKKHNPASGSLFPPGDQQDPAPAHPPSGSHKEPARKPSSSSSKQPVPSASHCSEAKSFTSRLACRGTDAMVHHPISSVMALLLLSLCCAWRCTSRSRRGDRIRGEYRAVAAQYYTESAFDDTFADDYSEGEYEEDEMGWTNGGKRMIEMKTIEDEENGGLTLEEMNG